MADGMNQELDVKQLNAAMWEQADAAASLMKSMSNKARLMILCMLSEGEKSVADLESRLATKQPNVSQQLARLRMENYVVSRRDGRTIYYSLADKRVKTVIDALYGAFCPTELQVKSS